MNVPERRNLGILAWENQENCDVKRIPSEYEERKGNEGEVLVTPDLLGIFLLRASAPLRELCWCNYANVRRLLTKQVLLAGVLLFCNCPLRVGAEETAVVARVGEAEVKADELRALLAGLDPADRAALARAPALLNRTVRAILVQRMVLQEALAKSWDRDPSVVARLERQRQATIVESYLDSVATPPVGYPSDVELKAAYDANRAAFIVPRQFRLAQIFVGAPKSPGKEETDKAQARVDGVVKKLRPPEADFAAIAKAQSEEPDSAAHGGEIGWLPENRIQPEIRLRVLGQAKDVVSEPIRLDDGWHIVKVLDVKEAYTASLADVREQLTAQMRTERAKLERQNYLARLVQKSPVSVNELAVSTVLEKTEK